VIFTLVRLAVRGVESLFASYVRSMRPNQTPIDADDSFATGPARRRTDSP
jgi:hypothetical protein